MPKQQSFEFVKMMTRYGVSLGYMIGFVGAIPVALMWFDWSLLLPVLALIVVITMCGGLMGMMYGAVSGFLSGLLMTTTTRLMFPEIKQHHLYKLTMGVLALSTTMLVFAVDYLWIGTHSGEIFSRSISPMDWLAIWVMSLVFAVYASQRTANQYLLETQLQ